MQLFYAPNIILPIYVLPEEESKHCVRVLRLSAGDTLNLTDGLGNLYTARVTDPNPKRCTVEIVETAHEFEKRDYCVTIAVAPTKNTDRFEWFLEKATEVGIDRIIPIDCRHSERRVIKPEREIKVITSAVKQSLKAYHPVLDDMTPLKEVIKTDFDGVKLIAHCQNAVKERKSISEYLKKNENVLILIGPEGDFSMEEINFAIENGFLEVTLGTSRLRTETAALAAVMNVSFINQ